MQCFLPHCFFCHYLAFSKTTFPDDSHDEYFMTSTTEAYSMLFIYVNYPTYKTCFSYSKMLLTSSGLSPSCCIVVVISMFA